MKKISTRNKAVVVSSFLTLLFFVFHFETGIVDFLTSQNLGSFLFPSVSAIVMFLGIFWTLKFNIKGQRIFTIGLYASISVFIISLFFELLLFNQSRLGRITSTFVYLIIVFLINYLILLTMNILNRAHLDAIPLGQAALASSYIFSLFIQFFGFFILASNNVYLPIKFALAFFMVFFYSYALLWNIETHFLRKLIPAFAIGAITVVTFMILSIWPISTEILAFVLILILYITLGIALEVKEKMGKYVWWEYGSLIFMIFFILILSANWGINGPII